MNSRNNANIELFQRNLATAHNANAFLTPVGSQQCAAENLSSAGEQFHSHNEALQWFERERPNLIDLIRTAKESGQHQIASTMANVLWGYFNLTKHWADWLECTSLGLAAARTSGDPKSEAYLLMSQGVAYRNLRRTIESMALNEQAICLFRQPVNDCIGLAYALQNLANAQSDAGFGASAFTNFDSALKIFTATANKRGQAVTLNSMAAAFNAGQGYEKAITAAQQASDIMQVMNDSHGNAIAMHNLATAFAGKGRRKEALDYFQTALQLRQEMSDRHGEAQTRFAMGQLAMSENQPTKAVQYWEDALDIFVQLDAPESVDVREKLERITSDA